MKMLTEQKKWAALISGINLPTHLRICYLLTFQWGFTPEELAILFGISRQTVNFYLDEVYRFLKLKLPASEFNEFLS